MNSTINRGLIVAAAVAVLFSTSCFAAEANKAAATATTHTKVKVKCLGINSCKGKSNSCKGKGWEWVKANTPAEADKLCEKKGGKVMEEEHDSATSKKK
ncbi:hypothetical protein BH10PSE19_BH10PSE19_16190 [soil metagenome]